MNKKSVLPRPEEALPGRSTPLADLAPIHAVNGHGLFPPWPPHLQLAMFGLGCFWGAERVFWRLPGVHITMVGYAGGYTPNPTYREVCSGLTGHNEVVRVLFHPAQIDYAQLLRTFWESHDPTQGMRQGNDVGTQYRSGIYTFDDVQYATALATRDAYAHALQAAHYEGTISTEILPAPPFYYAEAYHQQYLAKNPGGYCGIGGTGVPCPT